MSDTVFATVEDYEDRYGSVDDEGRLATLLADASDMLLTAYEGKYGAAWAEGEHAAFDRNARAVACAVAHRALSTPSGIDGATASTMTAGVYSQSVTWSNPTGDLWLGKSDLRRLGLLGARAGSYLVTGED